jgi:hypothetical protein
MEIKYSDLQSFYDSFRCKCKKNAPFLRRSFPYYVCPAAFYSHRGKPPTTIDAEELNGRVRDGNGCDLFAITTGQIEGHSFKTRNEVNKD